MPTVTQQVFI